MILDPLGRGREHEAYKMEPHIHNTLADELEIPGCDVLIPPVIATDLDHILEQHCIVDRDWKTILLEKLVGILEEGLEGLNSDLSFAEI